MIIREFKQSDAAKCCQIINSCVNYMTGLNAQARFYILSKNIPDDFYTEIKDDYALVAELHGQIVGVGSLRENEIRRLYVSPDFQGSGIGETLMLSLEAEAQTQNVETITLQCPPNTVEFYQHLGYNKNGISHSEIGLAKFDVVNMSKSVPKPASV